ncbi:D-aminoacyl-tRNA deacylase [Bacillus sp. JCM 19034]|uniref:D-aminoacyl-tRNA deacylase n=1 Tax=Bacillus sp. JCM 19034 TaxID=1481928 RepID=UPI0007816A70|nr:D-aminoacyl-tRNA deacylase [Bacillus sp. JCM 19034]
MKVVLQRTKKAAVHIDGECVGQIQNGVVLLVGITHEDTIEDAEYLVEKITHLRIFEDENGKMNMSLKDSKGQVLSVSQFTLYGDTRKGRRPNFTDAAKPEQALELYKTFNQLLREKGLHVETGRFGAMMDVSLVNDGPVTFILESKKV